MKKVKKILIGILIFNCIGLFSSCENITVNKKQENPSQEAKSVSQVKKSEIQKKDSSKERGSVSEIKKPITQRKTVSKKETIEFVKKSVKEIVTELAYDYVRWSFFLDFKGNPVVLEIDSLDSDDSGECTLFLWKKKKRIPSPTWRISRLIPYKDKPNVPNGYLFFDEYKDCIIIYDKNMKKKKKVNLRLYFDEFFKILNAQEEKTFTFQEGYGYVAYEHKYDYIKIMPIKKNRIGIIVRVEKSNTNKKTIEERAYYLLEFNIKKEKLESVLKTDHYIIGVNENYIFISNSNKDEIEVKDRKNTKYIFKLAFPEDAIGGVDDSVYRDFDLYEGNVYLANRTGIYVLSVEDRVWKQVVRAEDTNYIDPDNYISDFRVKNDHDFYLLLDSGGGAGKTTDFMVEYQLS